MGHTRKLIVSDANGRWFVRRIYAVIDDLDTGKRIYRCDKHISGPHKRLIDVPEVRRAVGGRYGKKD